MCGICGYFSPGQNEPDHTLQSMVNSLAHRGPDAQGLFSDSTAGLGHTRLSILDLSESANQPMHSRDGRFVIAYNGEVYNFREIASKLNISPRTSSDTEILLEAFSLKGADFVHDLNGMFAIAIYDKQKKELFIFRDRLGIKPLFYYRHEGLFFFSSELKGLTAADPIRKKLHIRKGSIGQFLHLGYIPEPHTIYENIFKFPSGHYLKLSETEFTLKKYWSAVDKIEPQALSDLTSAKKHLEKLLLSSVQYRLISDVPYGCFLSGGTDSSLVTSLAKELTGSLNTFSIGFKESKYNEAEHAQKVASHLGTTHHQFQVSHRDAIELIDEMIDTFDEPFADSSAIPTMLLSKLARKHVKMTLSGDGGDELFLGYGAYRWAERLSKPLMHALKTPIGFGLSKTSNRGKRAAHMFRFSRKADIRSHIFSQEQYLFAEREIKNVLTEQFYSEISLNKKFEEIKRKLSAKEQQALFDINYYLKDDLLVKVDRATMKYGLETRVPLLDYRIVEFALNLSPELKSKNGIDKFLLKEILYDRVPKTYFRRPKWGFALPLQVWMKKELRYLIEENLDKESVEKFRIVRFPYVSELKKRFFKGEDYLYNRLWALILLHKFLKKKI